MATTRSVIIGGTCKNGHSLTPENVRVREDRRGCIECKLCNLEGRARFNIRKPLYDVWKTMIRRCSDPSFKDWDLYGGREGNPVKVCEEWLTSYDSFERYMGPRPSKSHTIDRIKGDLGYEPGNVKWSTPIEQARNTSTNRVIEHNGVLATLAEWAEKSNMKYQTLFQRVNRGWDFPRAISTPVGSSLGYLKRTRDKDGHFI